MYKKILIAVDGSETSDKAVEWAVNTHSELPETTFTFLYVHQTYIPMTLDAGQMPIYYEPAEDEHSPAFYATRKFPDQSRVNYLEERGEPADLICRIADQAGYDLVVVGSKGHGFMASVLLGSVSTSVVQHAKCSVLIIR